MLFGKITVLEAEERRRPQEDEITKSSVSLVQLLQ